MGISEHISETVGNGLSGQTESLLETHEFEPLLVKSCCHRVITWASD